MLLFDFSSNFDYDNCYDVRLGYAQPCMNDLTKPAVTMIGNAISTVYSNVL